uniref:Uncharacterized protein n=1 Tax=Avena sativa TaxID=4498 RepID=A0ACD5T9W8_AVESA
MAMRRPKSEMSPPASPSDQRDAVIEELQKGAQLAESLRQQVELIPELGRRDAALANVSDISTALASSLSVLQSEREQYGCSSSDAATGHAAGAFGGGGVRARNGAAARARKAKHRRGTHGEQLPIKEMLTQTPENDRFHWRKYGEKKILNADFPRLYYRCGYSNEHKCPAKKYVQQQNKNEPPMFMVTLINDHRCHTLFPAEADQQPPPPGSSGGANNSQVLDFTKASLSSAAAVTRMKEEEDVGAGMYVTVPSYTYDELYSSSSLPLLSPKEWEMQMEINSLLRRHSGDGS